MFAHLSMRTWSSPLLTYHNNKCYSIPRKETGWWNSPSEKAAWWDANALCAQKEPKICDPIHNQVLDFGLNYFCSSKPLEHTLTQAEKASILAGMIPRTLTLNESKLHRFRTHIRTILWVFPLVRYNKLQRNRMANKNVQPGLTGCSSNLD